MHREGIDAGEGLVEQDEGRRGGQGAADLQPPPLAAREGVGRLARHGQDAQLLEQGARARARCSPAARPSVSRIASTFSSAVSLRKTLASCGR